MSTLRTTLGICVRHRRRSGSRLQGGVQVVHQGGRAGKCRRSVQPWGYVRQGEGVPQDYKEAVKWYTKAAEQGDVDAQYNLGLMYYNGEGVPKDLVQAYAWYDVAKANGQEKAKEWRDKIELTPLQFAEAQSLYTEIYKRIEANRQD